MGGLCTHGGSGERWHLNSLGEVFQLCGRRPNQADQPVQRTQGECVPGMFQEWLGVHTY